MSQPTGDRSISEKRASRSSSSPHTPLSLDLSSVPSLSQPSPPTNTLLVTDLLDLTLFQPPAIDTLKSQITDTAALNSFSPLPSFRRIVCSFTSVDDAIKVRQLLDGEALLGKKVRAKVYFGEHTPVEDAEEARKRKLLEAPQAEKLFFISPPPSPPHGWMMRNEDPPNKDAHASDLAEALNRLGRVVGDQGSDDNQLPETPGSSGEAPVLRETEEIKRSNSDTAAPSGGLRQRSRSNTLIYHPQEHGDSPGLPAVTVEDTTVSDSGVNSDMDVSPIEEPRNQKILAHTARPPVELME